MVSPYLDRDLQEGLEFVQEKMKKNICFKLLRKMSQFTYLSWVNFKMLI